MRWQTGSARRPPADRSEDPPHHRISWAYWLRDTIPGTTRVVTADDARLLFPEERPMDLLPHLEQHWAAATAPQAGRGPGMRGSSAALTR